MMRVQSFRHEKAIIEIASNVAFELPGVTVIAIHRENEGDKTGTVTLMFDSTSAREAYSHAYTGKLQASLVPIVLEHVPAHPGLVIPPRFVHTPCNRAWAKSAASSASLVVLEEGPESVTLSIDNRAKFRAYVARYLELTHTAEIASHR